MTPEKGKWYWVQFGYEVYTAKCIAVTSCGGIFAHVSIVGTQEIATTNIRAEAKKPWWRF